MNKRSKPRIGLVLLVVGLLSGFFAFNLDHSRNSQSIGWTPTNVPPAPFGSGTIAYGQSAPEFDVSLTDLDREVRPEAKPREDRQFELRIKPTHGSLDGFPVPSDVWLGISRRSNPPERTTSPFVFNTRTSMNPYAIENKMLVFRGSLAAPQKPGDYQIVGRVEYKASHIQPGQFARLTPLVEKSAEVELHVHQ